MPAVAGRRLADPARSQASGYALPPGHPDSWGPLTQGTVLQGQPYPRPVPGLRPPPSRPSEEAPP